MLPFWLRWNVKTELSVPGGGPDEICEPVRVKVTVPAVVLIAVWLQPLLVAGTVAAEVRPGTVNVIVRSVVAAVPLLIRLIVAVRNWLPPVARTTEPLLVDRLAPDAANAGAALATAIAGTVHAPARTT
ncbi:hypothetical protein [Nocardioides baculatus]|uniref:Uncharacterized protein n=1 Tax=Nocardioides baculatus TaxID=2801337 RepID=A0ABS1LEX4_9ACTN|nr:hypothetical protein [Nocardioides baculatus]MBL0749983.1 hypothetical protein [Nocardioides baculatus]